MSRTVTISDQTVAWINKAVENYDPLNSTTAQNTPAQLACWAIHNILSRQVVCDE